MKMLKKILCQILNKINKNLKLSILFHFLLLMLIVISGVLSFQKNKENETLIDEIVKNNNIIESFTYYQEDIQKIKDDIKKENDDLISKKLLKENNKIINEKIKELQKIELNKKKEQKIESLKKSQEKIKIQEKNKKISEIIKSSNVFTKKILEERKKEQKRLDTNEYIKKNKKILEDLKSQNKEINKKKKEQFKIDQIEYITEIKNKIISNWEQDYGVIGWSCEIRVIQNENGLLKDYSFGNCDGNELFKLSILEAVKKSEPLPLPSKNELFDSILNFTFIVE